VYQRKKKRDCTFKTKALFPRHMLLPQQQGCHVAKSDPAWRGRWTQLVVVEVTAEAVTNKTPLGSLRLGVATFDNLELADVGRALIIQL